MSMMLPPDPGAAPGLPVPPGGGDGGPPGPMDQMNQGPVPGDAGGMQGLLDALQGAGGPAPPGPDTPPDDASADMDSIDHIQQAMKHLMMALAKDTDEERGAGVVKGMGALQGILGGEQKKNAQAILSG